MGDGDGENAARSDEMMGSATTSTEGSRDMAAAVGVDGGEEQERARRVPVGRGA